MNVNEEWVSKARELIAGLALDCERHYLDKEIYKSILGTVEIAPVAISNWRTLYEKIQGDPPSVVKEKIGADTLPAIDFAIQGLSAACRAQALLDRVRRRVEGIDFARAVCGRDE